jgi:hypothetical protein
VGGQTIRQEYYSIVVKKKTARLLLLANAILHLRISQLMSAKRYAVEAQGQRFDIWEVIYYTDDLDGAKRYAEAMLESREVRNTRVVDQRTGEKVVDTSKDLQSP